MRYFIIKKDPEESLSPDIINWYGKIDVRNIRQGFYHALPERLLLKINGNERTVFTNIITRPFFLVSEGLKECLELYEPNLSFKEIVLLDQTYKQAQEYFLPTLEEVNCLTENCKFNMNRSELLEAEFELSKIGDKSIFYLGDVNSKIIVVRLDVAESMIRRGSRGFLLEEVTCR